MIISPMGEIIAEAGDEPTVIKASLDLEWLRRWRDDFRALQDIHRELLGAIDLEREA